MTRNNNCVIKQIQNREETGINSTWYKTCSGVTLTPLGWFLYNLYYRYQKSWAVVATLIAEHFPYRLVSTWLLWSLRSLRSGFHKIATIAECFSSDYSDHMETSLYILTVTCNCALFVLNSKYMFIFINLNYLKIGLRKQPLFRGTTLFLATEIPERSGELQFYWCGLTIIQATLHMVVLFTS